MSEIKVGEVVTIKTTGEQVFVLSIDEVGTEPTGVLSGTTAEVRVPVLTREGIKHVIETFLVEELESEEARLEREANMHANMAKQFETLQPQVAADPTEEPVN